MSGILTRRPSLVVPSDYARPMAPVEIADAVAMWGRRIGRTASLKWCAPKQRVWDDRRGWVDISVNLACWSVELSLRPEDPTLRAWREGRLKQDAEPTESVMLIEWDDAKKQYVPLNLEQYGASGIVSILERGNTWSGRGEFRSLQEAIAHVLQKNRENREKKHSEMRQWARALASDKRRSLLKIPFLGVGINLKGQTDG